MSDDIKRRVYVYDSDGVLGPKSRNDDEATLRDYASWALDHIEAALEHMKPADRGAPSVQGLRDAYAEIELVAEVLRVPQAALPSESVGGESVG